VKVHPDGTEALKKRAAIHRTFPRRTHNQDSSGCRKWADGPPFLALAGTGCGRTRRAQAPRRLEGGPPPATQVGRDGQGVRGQRGAPAGARLGAGAGGPPRRTVLTLGTTTVNSTSDAT